MPPVPPALGELVEKDQADHSESLGSPNPGRISNLHGDSRQAPSGFASDRSVGSSNLLEIGLAGSSGVQEPVGTVC